MSCSYVVLLRAEGSILGSTALRVLWLNSCTYFYCQDLRQFVELPRHPTNGY